MKNLTRIDLYFDNDKVAARTARKLRGKMVRRDQFPNDHPIHNVISVFKRHGVVAIYAEDISDADAVRLRDLAILLAGRLPVHVDYAKEV